MANTLEELRTENPALAQRLMAEARAAVSASDEQQRIQEIDALAGLFDSETINAAKYGDAACTAQEMVYRAALKIAEKMTLTPEKLIAEGRAAAKKILGTNQEATENVDGEKILQSDAVAGDNDSPNAQIIRQGRIDARALKKSGL